MSADFDELVRAAKRAAALLREAGVPFLLAGGLASWVRGGPATEHDVDFALRHADAERALQVLGDAGLRTERPPEEWLYKAFDGDVMIDLIFGPEGPAVDDAMFDRAEDLPMQAVTVPVLAVDDILISKLLALREHHLDYDSVLELARALREQIDWERVRAESKESPYARAFFTLADGLELTG
ncbi:MAG TPA: nucleotidyltransferase family protein [Acidimicrobiales bacterium]|nr:nucleotidyltransferase family protein [Acidimicrobiales bacterium]